MFFFSVEFASRAALWQKWRINGLKWLDATKLCLCKATRWQSVKVDMTAEILGRRVLQPADTLLGATEDDTRQRTVLTTIELYTLLCWNMPIRENSKYEKNGERHNLSWMTRTCHFRRNLFTMMATNTGMDSALENQISQQATSNMIYFTYWLIV